jgi:uncharacterized protein YgbK (DUF1537 family)
MLESTLSPNSDAKKLVRSRVITADDFTGACDVGVQFAKHRISTTVTFDTHLRLKAMKSSSTDLVVFDTETRNTTATVAYRRIRTLARRWMLTESELKYKKIDSTLRGNIGAELDAILDVFKNQIAIVAPSYPEYHRTSVDGNLLVAGKLLEKTEFAKNTGRFISSSNVTSIIASQTQKRIVNIPLSIVRKGLGAIANAVRMGRQRGTRIFCVDAVNRVDLGFIAEACSRTKALACGSAGLAEEIAERWFPQQHTRILVLCGSTSKATMEEIWRSRAKAKCVLIAVNASALLKSGKTRKQEINRIRTLSQKALAVSPSVIVSSARSEPHVIPTLKAQERSTIAKGMAASVVPLIPTGSVDAVVLTGGETAAAFLRQARVHEVRLESEIFSGIAFGIAAVGPARRLNIVTMAGGFGSPGSLSRIIQYLDGSASNVRGR